MHVRIRTFGKPDSVVVVESKLTKIEKFRRIISEKFDIEPKSQRLFYGGKLLEDGYTFHDYNIKLNDVIQLMIKVQPVDSTETETQKVNHEQNNKTKSNSKVYQDTESDLYLVGDLVDVKDKEHGTWLEGKIVKIVYDPETLSTNVNHETRTNGDTEGNSVKEDDHNTSQIQNDKNAKVTKSSITKFFSPRSKTKKQNGHKLSEPNELKSILYKIQLDDDEEDSDLYCTEKEIRPRARTVLEIKDLKIGQKVMVNYNTDEPLEKGYWYDFKVEEIKKIRSGHELVGTLYLGADSVPQNETKVTVLDKIFAIEEVVPVKERTKQYTTMMKTNPEKRSHALNCLTCRDDDNMPCKDCGCCVCLGKKNPETIVLCDECDLGYHMTCLRPPLTELPDDDWYCPSCARDTAAVVAPGAARQQRKQARSNRDWGRGMACVGKTKTCAMPPNHFGPIPGIEVGMCWRFRIQLSETGVHRPPVSGIHGRDVEGAYSIVLSGGYEDDVDNGNEFTYTGSGGRDLSGNKRTAEQSCDQTLTRENKALARNCAAGEVSEKGGDAGEAWKNGKPVRVVRSYKMLRHFPKYAPSEGIRYDGIYKVVKYYPEKGLSGFRVWKYLLRRDDPSPAPWEPNAKQYSIIYPDGYLEAEAEKKKLKEKKSKGNKGSKKREPHNSSDSDCKVSPPKKKRKVSNEKLKIEKSDDPKKSPKKKMATIFNVKSPNTKNTKINSNLLTPEEQEAIESDTLNSKLWKECLSVCHESGKKEFIEQVTQAFLCIICQDVAVNPITTPCCHNFCLACLKLAFKSNAKCCPCCRRGLQEPPSSENVNEHLRAALRAVMPGYDAGKK
ncbi:E3 ubiquitin-protein ligase UHRF1 [Papilio machaon]|uniref:E3 ubiquitin-protein ligase UHRF1 n=1 Tax=Papilio machaon TaxID=76193 RepID=UPI001E665876|nr:E3 ubiquitin-protein ligase UHRF1 [Papilio machaon]